MTGVLNAVVGMPTSSNYIVTMADIDGGGFNFGYNNTPNGSISPTTWRGVDVTSVSNNTSPSPDQFGVSLSGSRAQNFFKGIQVQKSDGSLVTLYTADASYADFTTSTSWIWSINGIWTAATPSPRQVRIFL